MEAQNGSITREHKITFLKFWKKIEKGANLQVLLVARFLDN